MSVNITDNMQVAVNLAELRYLVFNGMKGDTGEKGDPGADGVDGHSPYINASGYWVFWNDSTGSWTTTNYKAAGTNGTDGHSPYIGVNGNWFAWSDQLAMYDDTGVKAQGADGSDGEDGFSPTVTVTAITGGHRVTITDANGAHTFDVMDGEDGQGGGSITVDSALSDSSTNPVQNKVIKTALDGKGTYSKPSGGIPATDLASAVQTSLGKADTAYQKPSSGIPKTDLAGTVTWLLMPDYDQNDSNKFLRIDANGYAVWDAVQIEPNRVTVSGTTPTIAAADNTIYKCGEVSTLEITSFPASGIFSVIFESGSTATTLTVPQTLVMPDSFAVEANKRYEISVMDGYATAQGWAVSAS